MGVNHGGLFIEISEDLVVSIAFLKVLISSLVAASDEIDATILSGDGPGVQRYLKLHLNLLFLKFLIMNLENVGVFLIPLERVNPAGNTRLKAIFNVVIDS